MSFTASSGGPGWGTLRSPRPASWVCLTSWGPAGDAPPESPASQGGLLLVPAAQVRFDHFWVGLDFLWGAFGDFAAVVEDAYSFRDAHDDVHVVLDQQDRDSE